MLDVAFSTNSLAISESTSHFRIFSLDTGEEIGNYQPKNGYHILSIIFDENINQFICLLYGYKSTAYYYLIHISEMGILSKQHKVDDGYASAFLKDRKSYLNASGIEIDYESGREIFAYNFQHK